MCAEAKLCGRAFAVGVLPLAETVNPQLLLRADAYDRRVEEYERQVLPKH